MNDDPIADDPNLASAASFISRGTPVDWDAVVGDDTSSHREEVVAELKALETLAMLNDPVPVTWGPFVISGEIGRGAFGVVYRVTDPSLQMDLALKVIRPRRGGAIDPTRALSEARLLAQVIHPNVVRVYRAEQIGDEVGVAMELVNGESLATLVRRQGPYNARETMLIALDLCHALAAVHGAKVLHGDVKAHNVMRAEGGRMVLMDFGSAKPMEREADEGNSVTGTPLYLAPEVFAGGPRTRASDIYSLGVLMYFLTTGSHPVAGTTRTEVERRHREEIPRVHLRDVRPDLPDTFVRLVDRALATRPEDRYQTAGALEADLNRALALESQDTPKPRLWQRVGIAAALLALAGTIVVIFQSGKLWSGRETAVNGPPPSPPVTDAPVAAPLPPPAADEYRIQAAVFREQDGKRARLDHLDRINPGDTLSLEVMATVPVHVYVVNEDERGEAWLLFPLDVEQAKTALAAGRRHRLPVLPSGDQISWEVSSLGGREHILLFASRERPSPAFERIFAGLPRPVFGKPVNYQKLSRQGVQTLRGIGGLQASPMSRDLGARLTKEFAVPLTAAEEAVRGVWVRQLTLDNP